MALERGFELLVPEDYSLPEQIRLMAETAVQIGEHGSAQHASIYSPFGTIVGSVNPVTPMQVLLGRLSHDRNVLLLPDNMWRDERGNLNFSCSQDRLDAFFANIALLESGGRQRAA